MAAMLAAVALARKSTGLARSGKRAACDLEWVDDFLYDGRASLLPQGAGHLLLQVVAIRAAPPAGLPRFFSLKATASRSPPVHRSGVSISACVKGIALLDGCPEVMQTVRFSYLCLAVIRCNPASVRAPKAGSAHRCCV